MKIPRRPTISDRELDRRLAMSYLEVSRATEADEEKIQRELDDITARAAVLAASRRDRVTKGSSAAASGVASPEQAKTIAQRLKMGRSAKVTGLFMFVGFCSMALTLYVLHKEDDPQIVMILTSLSVVFYALRRLTAILLPSWVKVSLVKVGWERGDTKRNVTDTEDRLTNT